MQERCDFDEFSGPMGRILRRLQMLGQYGIATQKYRRQRYDIHVTILVPVWRIQTRVVSFLLRKGLG
jgi:hypothetical protein